MKIFYFGFAAILFSTLPKMSAESLPSGVPRIVDTNGEVLFIDYKLTTPAFQNEGLRLVMAEADKVVSELNLHETVPITISNVTRAYIAPFAYFYMNKRLGNVTTSNYSYNVAVDYKFSDLVVADYDACYTKYQNKKYLLPVSQLDTNTAYKLAAKWLADVHMDVQGLETDCVVRVQLSSEMDGTKKAHGKFTPVYFVSWTPKGKRSDPGGGAYVELYLPTKSLLQLCVCDSKYILRPPVVFTNLAALFPGKATITTNWPVEIKVMDASSAVSPPWLQHPPAQ